MLTSIPINVDGDGGSRKSEHDWLLTIALLLQVGAALFGVSTAAFGTGRRVADSAIFYSIMDTDYPTGALHGWIGWSAGIIVIPAIVAASSMMGAIQIALAFLVGFGVIGRLRKKIAARIPVIAAIVFLAAIPTQPLLVIVVGWLGATDPSVVATANVVGSYAVATALGQIPLWILVAWRVTNRPDWLTRFIKESEEGTSYGSRTMSGLSSGPPKWCLAFVAAVLSIGFTLATVQIVWDALNLFIILVLMFIGSILFVVASTVQQFVGYTMIPLVALPVSALCAFLPERRWLAARR